MVCVDFEVALEGWTVENIVGNIARGAADGRRGGHNSRNGTCYFGRTLVAICLALVAVAMENANYRR